MCRIANPQTQKSEWWLPGLRNGKIGRKSIMVMGLSFGMIKNVLELDKVAAAHHCEFTKCH